MRIALAGQSYRPSSNGPAVFTANLAEALVRAGHQALVLIPSPDGRGHAERRNGVELRALPAVVWKRAAVAVTIFPNTTIARLLADFAPDVVHVQDHYPTSRAVIAESRRRGVPVIGTNHFVPGNMALQLPLPPATHGMAERLLWWTVESVFRRLDLVTAPSATAAALLRQRLPDLDIRAISCGVDTARFRPRAPHERRRLRERFNLPGTAAVALYVGRLDRDKNLGVLLEAMTRSATPELLLLAGKGLHLQALRDRARRLGLGGRVRFSGYVPDSVLPELYAAADLFVMPSAVELLSIATLEAMASGLPVAAARAGALPELVTPGVQGWLFDPFDPDDAARTLAALVADRSAWRRLGQAARRKAEEHRLELTRARFEALYREARTCPRNR